MRYILALALALSASAANAQPAPSGLNGGYWTSGQDCNAVTFTGPTGPRTMMVDRHGNLCVSTGTGATTVPGSIVITSLDAKTTGVATAVTALNAGHRTKGGWIQNPPSATINLCIDEIGTASGAVSSGDTTCIIPGQTYKLAPSPNAVSVISSDGHGFSGEGWQ